MEEQNSKHGFRTFSKGEDYETLRFGGADYILQNKEVEGTTLPETRIYRAVKCLGNGRTLATRVSNPERCKSIIDFKIGLNSDMFWDESLTDEACQRLEEQEQLYQDEVGRARREGFGYD